MGEELVKAKSEIIETPEEAAHLAPIKEWFVEADLPHIPFRQLINQALQNVNLANVISKIEKGTEYVVKVPLKFKTAYNEGKVFVAQNSDTGVLRPILAKWNEKGKYEFVSPMEMVERTVKQGGNALQGLADRYQNMAMQQQIAQLSELMEHTHEVVRRIEQGQYDDRIGLLNAGRNQILIALSNPDDIDIDELKAGRNNLQIGCAQIIETVHRRSSEFPKISKSRIVRDLKLMAKSYYYSSIDDEYGKIEDCFGFFLQGTKMLAASYAICGDVEKAELVFDQAKEKVAQIDFSKVERIGLIHPNEIDWISNQAPEYLEYGKVECIEQAKKYDMLTLKVSGEQLLEAFKYEREERIQEEATE